MRKIILLLFISFYSIVSSSQIFDFKDKPIPPYQDAVAVNGIREEMTRVDEYLLNNAPQLQPMKIVMDTVINGNIYVQQKINSVSYGYVDNKLSRLTVIVNNGLTDSGTLHDVLNNPSHVINFYFDSSGLISIIERYTNQSRMGSCGTVTIIKSLYYQGHKILWHSIEQNPYHCYSENIVVNYYAAIMKKLNIEF